MNLYWPEHLLRSRRRREARKRARWAEADKAATQVLVASHGHCLDGVGSAIVARRVLSGVGVAYLQPGEMAAFLEALVERARPPRRLLVCDLSLQREQYPAIVEACRRLKAAGWSIEWRDHHHKQWEGLDLGLLRAHLAVLEVNADATESGASLVQKALAPADPFLRRFAETVRDRDLWWNKTPDSEALEFALSQLGTRRFEALHLAAPADAPALLPEAAAAAQRERDEQKAVLDRLLSEARYYGEGPTRVGIVYGWLPKNTGLHELLEERGCRIAANVRPNGKVSLRSRRDAPVCHLVAQRFAGGGHPNASGADLGLRGLAYGWYVLRRGRVAVVERFAQACVEQLAKGA